MKAGGGYESPYEKGAGVCAALQRVLHDDDGGLQVSCVRWNECLQPVSSCCAVPSCILCTAAASKVAGDCHLMIKGAASSSAGLRKRACMHMHMHSMAAFNAHDDGELQMTECVMECSKGGGCCFLAACLRGFEAVLAAVGRAYGELRQN